MSKVSKIQKGKNIKSGTSPKVAVNESSSPVKEYNFKIVALIGFSISLILLIFCYHCFNSYFETNDDPRYVMAMKGFATPKPYDNFVSVYIFTIDLYIYLYQHFPNIGWYGYSMFFLILGAFFNFYISLYLLAIKRINFLLINLIFISLVLLIFLQNIYLINFTRPSILCTSGFIIFLGAMYLNQEIFRKNRWILIFPVITYIFAHFTRLDAGYLGFLIGAMSSLLIVSTQKSIWPFLLKCIAPVFVFILLFKVLDVSAQNSNEKNKLFLEKTDIIRKLVDYKNSKVFKPLNYRDSIAYDAIFKTKYCNDDKVVSLDFIKRLSNESPLIESGNQKKFDEEFGNFIETLKYENIVFRNIYIAFFVILLIWLLNSFKNNWFNFSKYILLQVYFMAIIVGMSYYMKLPARIFSPVIGILTLSNILLIVSVLHFRNRKFYYLISTIFLVVFFAFPAYPNATKDFFKHYKEVGSLNHRIIDDMNKFSNTIFIPTNLRSWETHAGTDPIHEINFKNNNCYVYLSIELCIVPETSDQLVSKFGTDDHSQLFNKISEMDNVIFVSSTNYNNFLRTYYHYLYKQDYYFEKINGDYEISKNKTGLNYYKLVKIK